MAGLNFGLIYEQGVMRFQMKWLEYPGRFFAPKMLVIFPLDF